MIDNLPHYLRAGLFFWFVAFGLGTIQAAVPQRLNHQGRVAVNGVNFDGNGQFKFALVNADGSVSYWSNDGTGIAGSQPTSHVTLWVTKGLYSVQLGDTTLTNMTALPLSALDYEDVRLRIWFNNGSRGFQLITPDQRLAAAPYALLAAHATSATAFGGSLAGDVTGTQGATSIAARTVTGKELTDYSSTTGTIFAEDTILTAIGKLNGNSEQKAPLESPTFKGEVKGITAMMVGLGNVDNTSDANKPVSMAQKTALDLKAPLNDPVFTGEVTATGSFKGSLQGNAATATTAQSFTGDLLGDVVGPQGATSIATRTVTGKELTDYSSTTGTISAEDTILTAIGKLNGNSEQKASLNSPQFTGTPTAPTPAETTDNGQIATTAFVHNTIDVLLNTTTGLLETLEQLNAALGDPSSAALNFAEQFATKASIASPSFSGTVTLPAGTESVAPLKFITGTKLSTEVFGSVEFDGTNLYLTNNYGNPTRKTIAFTDSKLAPGAVGSNQLASGLTLSGTTTGTFSGPLAGNVTGNVTGSAASFTGSLAGEVTGTQGATSIADRTVTGKALAGYSSTAGTISVDDTILTAINKLNGNDALKAPIDSPIFTGTVSGITASMVGLGNVSNTSDANKPISMAQQTALNLKANLASPSFTGTVTLPAGTASAAPLKLATGTNLSIAVLGSVEFDGTNLYLTINSGNPTRKTIAFTDSALAPGAVGSNQLASELTLGGKTTGTFIGPLTGNVTGNVTGSAASFTGSLAGEVTGTQGATSIAATTVTGKPLTGYLSGAGTILASDTILSAINKLNGNNDLKANSNNPTIANPTFTGTVGGLTKSMVGLGNVTNTSDADKPVSNAQLAALNAKAPLASPTFTGTVVLPAGSTTAAPLRLTAGTNLTAGTLGAVEFDGNNLYLTINAASPTRKTVALSDTGSSSQIGLSSVVAAPLYPVVAWGNNKDGQALAPVLANVAAVAAGTSHSIALLDDGQVVEWGKSVGGTKPTLTGVTDIAAGGSHNLVRQSNGRVLAWGADGSGQATVPTDIVTAVKVAAGARHSLALLANGTVRGWGEDYFGKNAAPASLTGMTVIAIAAGENHSLALKNTGEVVAWGSNAAFQTDVPAEALSGVTAIAAGWNHNLALKSNGSVVAWGYNAGGQSDVPTAASSGVVQIAAGDTYSMALKADGTLVTWGFRAVENPVTVVPDGTTQVTQIAAGGYHALALRADSVPVQLAQLDSSGRLGIGRTPLLNALEVKGNASKSTAGSWLANSDRRIKTDIESITGALDKLDRVRLVDFRYTDEYLAAHPEIENRRYPNVIAQEFQQVFPDEVKGSGEILPDGSEVLHVDTYPLTIYSAAAIQELHRENSWLKKKLNDQEKKLNDQDQSIRNLEEILKNK